MEQINLLGVKFEKKYKKLRIKYTIKPFNLKKVSL